MRFLIAHALVVATAVWVGEVSAQGKAAEGANAAFAAVPAGKVGAPGEFRSFGATGAFFRVRTKGGARELPIKAEDISFLQPESLRLYRYDEAKRQWQVLPESRYDEKRQAMTGAAGPGLYTALGASRVEEIYDVQRAACPLPPRGSFVPEICTQILCTAEGFSGEPIAQEIPFRIGQASLRRQMGGICEQCLKKPTAFDFPECQLPHFTRPERIPDRWVFPWPIKKPVDVSNACVPGPHRVGRVDYNFENEFDLVPSGSTTPAYPGVDVRATVRYPATASGANQPVAGTGRYPLVVFLHGNHYTCQCSCDHSCAASSRVPSHLGYDYLLDMLASWGFIAVSIDGFDVTCAGSFAMSDYEARGRLVLRHLEKWKGWDSAGGDPWGNRFRNRVDMNRIGLSGHSRGGEGVVAAEVINRAESLGYHIKAVNAIAPTDQDPLIRYVPQVPYFLLLAAADGDVSNLQGLRTYDRTSLAASSVQSEKSMLWVYGANHNFFNSVWTPGTGFACASDDGSGTGRLSDSLQRLVACQSIVPFFRLHLQGQSAYRALFRGDVLPQGLAGVRMYWGYQDPTRKEVDNFDAGDNAATNSMGGAVATSGGFATMDEFEFKPGGADVFNGSFRHFTHGLVLGWNSTQSYRTTLPAGQRDVSGYTVLALRVGQIIDGGVLNPVDTPRTFRVSLRTTGGTVSNVDFDTAGIQSVPYPYPANGAKTVLGTLRVPLKSFRNGNVALPLSDIESVALEFRGTGLIAVDDIQFSK